MSVSRRRFVDWLKSEHNIRMRYIATRSKAYMAERMLKFVRTRVMQVLGRDGRKDWLAVALAVVKEYNSRMVRPTSFRRSEIDVRNYDQFMKEKYGLDSDIHMTQNLSSLDSRSLPAAWARRLWLYKDGERVLLSRRADYRSKNPFHKASEKGAEFRSLEKRRLDTRFCLDDKIGRAQKML